jgi:tRNA-intron endonuclease
MSNDREDASSRLELRIKGLLGAKSVRILDKQAVDELSSRGYGVVEDEEFQLALHEALYLLDKGTLEVEDKRGGKIGFQRLLKDYESVDENAWAKYLVYRDLRSRGYVVREGFGLGVDFRLYERGEYSKDAAKFLILSIQEGKPISLEGLTSVLKQCQSLKKDLILAVMNRRGEIVYYSVSELMMK